MKSKRYSRKASQVGSGKTERETEKETEREREIQDDEGDSYHDFRVWTASICHYSAPCWFQRISLKIKKKKRRKKQVFFLGTQQFQRLSHTCKAGERNKERSKYL